MEAKERWQALQSHLTRARDCLTAGDRVGALEAVNAALAIDPNFLAAQALRDRIVAQVGVISKPVSSTPAPAVPALAPEPVRPLVSAPGYAQFEQRARRRRVDRRVDAARAAIAEGRSRDAANAIGEIRELDPNLPELHELSVAFSTMTVPTRAPRRVGRWLAAAAVFGAIMLGATWLEESGALGSRSIVSIVPLVAPQHPLAIIVTAAESELPDDVATGTSGDSVAVVNTVARPMTNAGALPYPAVNTIVSRPLAIIPASTPPEPAPPVPPAAAPIAGVAAPTPAPAPIAAPAPVAAPPPSSPAPVPTVVTPDDEVLVTQTLQRYRKAYEGLDARSARAVWPAVNETALARAFDGLASQSLNFEACNVTLRGEAAAAICRGTTRYTPKVGSREPRTEPRTWNFTLKKAGTAWTIESARADR